MWRFLYAIFQQSVQRASFRKTGAFCIAEKLLAAQEKTQEKLRRAQEEEKQLKKRIAELKRNERTHRLCTRGGYVEKLFTELGAPELSDEEVFEHLHYALNTPYAKTHLENLMKAKRKAAAEAEGTEAGNLAD